MRNHLLSGRTASLLTAGFAPLVASTGIILSEEPRVCLDESVLARSRGSNVGSSLKQTTCDSLNGNAACNSVGAVCATCSQSTYTDINPGGSNYTTGGASTCGNNMGGMCNNLLQCKTQNQVGVCAAPNAVKLQ